MLFRSILLIFLLFFLLFSNAFSGEIPKLKGWVNDYAELLTPEQESQIATQCAQISALGEGAQVVVLTTPSLEGRAIEEYTIKIAEAWKIGQKEKDNGVILCIAPTERRLRIEVGYGLEEWLTDARSSIIINSVITPAFKKGDYFGGISGAITEISSAILHDSLTVATPEVGAVGSTQEEELSPVATVIIFLIIIVLLFTRTGREILFWMMISGLGRGGSGGRSSGGGFSGGGGGSFGGGGASGGW